MRTGVTPEQFRAQLKQRPESPLVIGISGFGGAGKSTLSHSIVDQLDKAILVNGDDFIVDQANKRCDDWGSIDRQRLVEQVLEPARTARRFRYQQYDWASNSPGAWQEHSEFDFLIVEGIGLFHPDVLRWFDVTAWLDVPLEVAEQRGKTRDRKAQGVDHDRLWDEIWTPNERDFLERFQPRESADFLISPETG